MIISDQTYNKNFILKRRITQNYVDKRQKNPPVLGDLNGFMIREQSWSQNRFNVSFHRICLHLNQEQFAASSSHVPKKNRTSEHAQKPPTRLKFWPSVAKSDSWNWCTVIKNIPPNRSVSHGGSIIGSGIKSPNCFFGQYPHQPPPIHYLPGIDQIELRPQRTPLAIFKSSNRVNNAKWRPYAINIPGASWTSWNTGLYPWTGFYVLWPTRYFAPRKKIKRFTLVE